MGEADSSDEDDVIGRLSGAKSLVKRSVENILRDDCSGTESPSSVKTYGSVSMELAAAERVSSRQGAADSHRSSPKSVDSSTDPAHQLNTRPRMSIGVSSASLENVSWLRSSEVASAAQNGAPETSSQDAAPRFSQISQPVSISELPFKHVNLCKLGVKSYSVK